MGSKRRTRSTGRWRIWLLLAGVSVLLWFMAARVSVELLHRNGTQSLHLIGLENAELSLTVFDRKKTNTPSYWLIRKVRFRGWIRGYFEAPWRPYYEMELQYTGYKHERLGIEYHLPLWYFMVVGLTVGCYRAGVIRTSTVAGSCSRCGYDLSGLSSAKKPGVCPECGPIEDMSVQSRGKFGRHRCRMTLFKWPMILFLLVVMWMHTNHCAYSLTYNWKNSRVTKLSYGGGQLSFAYEAPDDTQPAGGKGWSYQIFHGFYGLPYNVLSSLTAYPFVDRNTYIFRVNTPTSRAVNRWRLELPLWPFWLALIGMASYRLGVVRTRRRGMVASP
jgi:hypothetical protein